MPSLFSILAGLIFISGIVTTKALVFLEINLSAVPSLVSGSLAENLQLATNLHLRAQLKTNDVAVDLIDRAFDSNELTLLFSVDIQDNEPSALVKSAFDSESKIFAYKELLMHYGPSVFDATESVQVNVEGDQVWPALIYPVATGTEAPAMAPDMTASPRPSTTISKASDFIYVEMRLDNLPRELSGRLLFDFEYTTRNFIFTESRTGSDLPGVGDVKVVQQHFLSMPTETDSAQPLLLDLLIDVSSLNFEASWIPWVASAWYTNSERERYTNQLRELDPVIFDSLKSVDVRVEGDQSMGSFLDRLGSNKTRSVISYIELHLSSMLEMIEGNTRLAFEDVSESYLMESYEEFPPLQVDVNIMYQKFARRRKLDETYVLHPHTLILGISVLTEYTDEVYESEEFFMPQILTEKAFDSTAVATYITRLRQIDSGVFKFLWDIDLVDGSDIASTPDTISSLPSAAPATASNQVSEMLTIIFHLRYMRGPLSGRAKKDFELTASFFLKSSMSNRDDLIIENIDVTSTIVKQALMSGSKEASAALSFPGDRRRMQEDIFVLGLEVSIHATYNVSEVHSSGAGELLGASFKTAEQLSVFTEQLRSTNPTVFEQLTRLEIVDRLETTNDNDADLETGGNGKWQRWLIIAVVIVVSILVVTLVLSSRRNKAKNHNTQ